MKLVRPRSLKELAIEELRSRIVDGRIGLGDLLSENLLAAELGISKTPIREALLQLQTDGLVHIQPARGTIVFQLTAEDVTAITQLRVLLEVASIEAAAATNYATTLERLRAILATMNAARDGGDVAAYREADSDFHEAIVHCSGNDFFERAYSLISFRFKTLRAYLSRNALLNEQSFGDHRKIVDLLAKRRFAELSAVVRHHADGTRHAYLSSLAGPGDGGRGGEPRPRDRADAAS
jgi:DNA-binding GntR family transcriptional regulator